MDITLNHAEPTDLKQLTLFDDVEAGSRLEHADKRLLVPPQQIDKGRVSNNF